MNPEIFIDDAPGRLVPVAGIRGISHAFVPDPLPPRWTWPGDLWPLLVESRTALASLDGTGKHLPNPQLLLLPLQSREAQRSSSLEGTVTDPQQQALFQIDPQYPTSAADPVNAYREVFNYREALNVRARNLDLPLSLRLIRKLHEVLMDGVRGSDQSPGEFRRTQNQIGRPARFVPPPVPDLAPVLDGFEKYLNLETPDFDPLVRAFLAHYQFEAIHPFSDGNGRVGRLLLAITIAEWCGLSNQWLYMSAFFDANKDHYIDLLLRVSTNGDWGAWIRFCLEGVVEQAKDTERRCERLLALHRQFHDQVNSIGGSIRLSTIVDQLFVSPVITVTEARNLTAVTYPTASKDLAKLAAAGILSELPRAQQISYYCGPIFKITYEE